MVPYLYPKVLTEKWKSLCHKSKKVNYQKPQWFYCLLTMWG